MNVIEFTNVWKKFRKGEKFDSLRDAIPNFFKKTVAKKDELQDREFWAVKDVSFNITKGEVVGIMGPNGAGKSTILKMLSGIYAPNKGTMAINGRLSALIEVTAGFHPELTGRENVYLNGTILGMKKKEIDAKFDQIVEFSGVSEFIDTPVKRYSSGMFSRLGFSVAAHMDPDILIVDEVLAVGDIAFQAKCAHKMRELMHSGATIVLVSHQLNMIQSLCKRVILLNKGEVLKDGPTDEVIPLYQNIIFKRNEEDLKVKITSQDSAKVKVNTESSVNISSVKINGENGPKEEFRTGERMTIDMECTSEKPVESPVFTLDIVRSDGILCYSARSDLSGFKLPVLNSTAKLSVDLGKLSLSAGIYSLKAGVWDKDLIHPYVIRTSDIFRIVVERNNSFTNAVIMPETKWKPG